MQLVCEPEDAGVARQLDLALVAPNDEVLVGAALEVTTEVPPQGDWEVRPRVLNQVVHLRQRIEQDGALGRLALNPSYIAAVAKLEDHVSILRDRYRTSP